MPNAPFLSLCVLSLSLDDPWYAEMDDVARLCISSMLKHCSAYPGDVELIIMDNGSTSKTHKDMLRSFNPTVFIDSRDNRGSWSGFNSLFSVARGKYLAYTDNDILHYPGWWDAEFEVLKTYPDVGTVSSCPCQGRGMGHYKNCNQNTIRWAKENAHLEIGNLISNESAKENGDTPWIRALGRKPDFLMTYQGVKAWAHGRHMQYICERSVTAPLFVRDSSVYYDQERIREKEMDDCGLKALNTYEKFTHHMGNTIDDFVRAKAQAWGLL